MFAHSQDFRFRLFPKIFPLILAALALAFHPMDKAANAQAADETAKRFNHLPLVADGEGIRSTLLITNVADSSNQCSLVFLANQLDADDFETHAQVRLDGTGTTVELPSSGSHVSMVSANGSTLALDSATLDCAEPVVARVLITLSAGGALQTAATLPSAETGAKFSFPVIPRVGGNFLIAQNQHASGVNCGVELLDESGVVVAERSHAFPATTTIVRNLAELVQIPPAFGGGSATVTCDRQIAATGLLAGAALSGLPPVVLSRQSTAIAPTAPDLVVDSASVSDDTLETGQAFSLRATVRNTGDGQAGSTTLRWYRSADSTISPSDTQVGTDAVGALGALATSSESISLTAPSTAGAHYYGGCVDSVNGESGTGNNCSSGVRVTVSAATTNPPPEDGACVEVNDVVELGEGESCTITQALVDKYSLGSVSVRAGDIAMCSGGRVSLVFFSGQTLQLNGLTIRCR